MNGATSRTSTYTVGVRRCADEAIAEHLSLIAGTRHHFIELDEHHLENFLSSFRRMVSLTDGMYLSHGLTEAIVLDFLQTRSFAGMLRGHCGELAKMSLAWPLHTDDTIRAIGGPAALIPYLLSRFSYVTRCPLSDLFERRWAEAVGGQAKASLEKSVLNLDLRGPDLCSHLYLMEVHRRFTLAAIAPIERLLPVLLPFADPEFLTVLFAGPSEWRDGTEIHRAIMNARAPALLAVRNSNTGAPGNAGPIREAVMDKVNTALRRLGVPRYRHYHTFDRWMREKLLASVESTLLCPEAMARGIFKPSAVRSLIDQTRAASSDHAHLLQVLLTLELWQQEMS
jgi:asparagine synthase (glutamine-hydrolysing)